MGPRGKQRLPNSATIQSSRIRIVSRRVQIVRLCRGSRYSFRPILVSGGAWVVLLRIPKSRSWQTGFGGGQAAFAVLEHYCGLTQALRTAEATFASR
jgi:hypothetical protein